MRSVHIPAVDGDMRISLAFHAPESHVSQALTHHWHVQFQLPNRFTLKDNIQETGGRLVYETPEIWVVEISGHDVDRLKEVIRGIHGIALNLKDDSISTDTYKDIPVAVSLYIEEG